MIKTVSINLSGQVFQIDQNAYDKLKDYLEAIRQRFASTQGKDEIIADIESRIAEMFLEKISSLKQSITIADVELVIAIMGKPEQFEGADDADETTDDSTGGATTKKRIFRDSDDKVLGGVCSGLSAYLGIDEPLWLRIAMVVFLFASFGTAFWIYVILWIIIPEAKTASDKLQMRGEAVTIDSIEKTIKDDFEDLKTNLNAIKNKDGRPIRNFIHGTVSFLGTMLRLVLRAFMKIVAFVFVLIGIVITLALIFGFLLPVGVMGISFPLLFDLIFENQTQIFLGGLGTVLLIGVPAFVLIFSGIRLLLGTKTRYRMLGISMTGLWFVGLILVIYVGASIGKSFSNKETVKEIVALQTEADTLKLEANLLFEEEAKEAFRIVMSDKAVFAGKDDNTVSASFAQLDIAKSEGEQFEIEIKKSARGRSRSDAAKRAETISYQIEQKHGSVVFPSHFDFAKKDKYRSQDISITLLVPEGKIIFLSSGMEKIIYDIKNTTNTFDYDMIGHYWQMTPEGLTCLDCNFSSSDNASDENGVSYDLDGYNEIQVDGFLNVDIKQGDNYSVVVTGGERFTKNFNAQKDGSTLKIASDFQWKNFWSSGTKGTVYITTPVLHRLDINGINKVNIDGFKTDNLAITINGASKNKFILDVNTLALELNGASKAEIKGKATTVKIESAGASEINAEHFEINDCNIDLTGASKATVFVNGKLNVDLSGASKLKYNGTAKVTSDVTGGSAIEKTE
jgi:phage shock protein PspC (stress-responsive transcriptional regulator)